MLLQRLVEYSDRLVLPPPNYVEKPVAWIVELDGKGDMRGVLPTGDPKDRSSLLQKLCPHSMRAVAIRAKLLADNGEYVFGITREGGNAEKVQERHESFVQAVRDCAEATGNPDVRAVQKFLENYSPGDLDLPDNFDPSHEITFRVDDRFPIDQDDVQRYWASTFEDPDAAKMQCVVCGEARVPEKRLQQKIKRIPGGQTSGNALISANAPAFESHGLRASLIAPTCSQCAEKFSHAANDLLQKPQSHIAVGPLVYVFWTKEDTSFDARQMFFDPQPESVKALIESAWKGKEFQSREDYTPFYAAALTASGARVAVRDWIDTTVGSVKRALARYFVLQQITEWDGSRWEPLKLFSLAGATVRDFKDLPARVPRALIRFALTGGVLPRDLLFQAVRRNKAEQSVTRPRAALIKLCLLSNNDFGLKEEEMVKLDYNRPEPAYQCGRLLAVLENVQRAALGKVGATIVDRYYGTASSAPATVFGTLLRGSQAHLSKLRKTKPGLHVNLQKELEGVTANLSGFPAKLSLKDQALFSLGYYHQRAHRGSKADDQEADE